LWEEAGWKPRALPTTRSDVSPSAKRLDPKTLDLIPLHVSSDEMDPEDFRKIFGLR